MAKKTTRSTFKAYCLESFQRMKELARDAEPHYCSITLGKKRVIVEIEDPHNVDGLLTFKYDYEPDVEEKLLKKLEEIESILRTIYQPLYLTFTPTVKTQLKNVSLEYDSTGVFLEFADGRPTEPFDYNHDEYERFVARIGDLLLSATNTPQSGNKCRNSEHCQSCQDIHCTHSPNYTKALWKQLEPEAQQKFLNKLNLKEQSAFLQLIEQEEK